MIRVTPALSDRPSTPPIFTPMWRWRLLNLDESMGRMEGHPKTADLLRFFVQHMVWKRKTKLPEVGSVYGFPLGNGLFSVCRVVKDRVVDNYPMVLVACSQWIGGHMPNAPTADMRSILVPTYYNENEPIKLTWAMDPPPKKFGYIGNLPPSADDGALDTDNMTGWLHLLYAALTQWRWDNERDGLLADDRLQEAKMLEDAKRRQAEYDSELESLTLAKLVGHKFFPDWTDYPSRGAKKASRDALKRLVDTLIELGRDATADEKLAAVKSCIESFDDLNDRYGDFMDTMVKDDVVEEVGRIAYAAGLPELEYEQMNGWWSV